MNPSLCISAPRVEDNPLILVNPAFTDMTGYTDDELRGKNCRILQGGDTAQPGLAEIRAALAEGREGRGLLRNYRKSGEPFENVLFLFPVPAIDTRPILYLGMQFEVPETGRATAFESFVAAMRDNLAEVNRRRVKAKAYPLPCTSLDNLTA